MIFVFTLSHSQSQVERGFNINDDIIVENMHNNSFIAQRNVYDHMKCNNFQSHSYEIWQKLRASVLSAYSKYKLVRDQKEKDTIASEKQQRSEVIESKIYERERKISSVKSTISNSKKMPVNVMTMQNSLMRI